MNAFEIAINILQIITSTMLIILLWKYLRLERNKKDGSDE